MSLITRFKSRHNREIHLESSAIKSIRYSAKDEMLYVQFQSGKIYSYKGVSQAEVDALLASPSKGRYFARMIKEYHPFSRESV